LLVPKDIVHWRTEPFWHAREFDRVFGKSEQRQILFHHKESESMFRDVFHEHAGQRENVLRNAGLAAPDGGS
jgi:hypothetical protein